MSRTRTTRLRAPTQAINGGGSGKEDEPKYFLTLTFSLLLCIILWLDHGPLSESDMASSGPAGCSPLLPTPTRSTTQAAEASIKRKLRKPFKDTVDRKSSLTFADFSKNYDCIKPVLISGAMQGWGATKWSRQMFVEKYGHELMALAKTKGGLNKREVYLMPVKELDGQMVNGSANSWSMSEDEMFLRMHPELQNDIGKLVYAKDDLFDRFPDSVRPSNVTLQWGSPYSRSPLRVHTYNWTSTDMLFHGRKFWKLFPPEQDKYLYPDQGGKLSGLALECRLYTSPVDAFMPDYTRYPLFEKARPYVAEQKAGEVLITPPGWYMQYFYPEESFGLSGQILNERNVDIVLTEIMKIREQVSWNRLPFNLESLPAAEQVSAVLANLHESVYWRANVTRQAQLLQFGGKSLDGRRIQLLSSVNTGQCGLSTEHLAAMQVAQQMQPQCGAAPAPAVQRQCGI